VLLRDVRHSHAVVVASGADVVSPLIYLYPTVCLGVGHSGDSRWTLLESPTFGYRCRRPFAVNQLL
jgi:hypothetical protein